MPGAWQKLYDDADGGRSGIQRLAGLDDAPTPPWPPTLPYGKDLTVEEWTEALRGRAVKEVPASVIRARQDRWDATEWAHLEPWMTLEPSTDLQCWREVMQEIGCDKSSCDALVNLVKQHGTQGMLECYRILSHTLKKNDINNREHDRRDRSTLLWGAAVEANEAPHDSDVDAAYAIRSYKKRKITHDHWDNNDINIAEGAWASRHSFSFFFQSQCAQ